MIFNSVNGSIIAFEIIDKYNIKSEDFVSRCANWISSCLDDLGIDQTYTPNVLRTTFTNSRCILPDFCKTIDFVVINGRKASYNESLYVLDDLDEHSDMLIDADGVNGVFGDKITTASFSINVPTSVPFVNDEGMGITNGVVGLPTFYRIANGWLHTNVTSGDIEIKYKEKPFEYDDILKLDFPMIPDEIHTKTAIMWYVLNFILMRGYIHPILNLKENNPLTNPGIAYKLERPKARVYCNSPNIDAREKYKNPLAALFGRRKTFYINAPKKVVVPPTIAFEDSGAPFCEVVDNQNTGKLLQLQREYKTEDGVKTATGVTRFTSTVNAVACPILLANLIFGFYPIDADINGIGFSSVAYAPERTITIGPKPGWYCLYVGIPKNKTFAMLVSGIDISSTMIKAGTLIRAGYVDRDIYRTANTFSTDLGFEFTVKLS